MVQRLKRVEASLTKEIVHVPHMYCTAGYNSWRIFDTRASPASVSKLQSRDATCRRRHLERLLKLPATIYMPSAALVGLQHID